MLPGRKCGLCGNLLLLTAIRSRRGDTFCSTHTNLPICHLCGSPFHPAPGATGSNRFCGKCLATSVTSQEQMRRVLPNVRATLQQIGIRLHPPVHIRLVDDATMRRMSTNESGMVGGLTVLQGRQVVEVYIVAGLPELEFGSTVAHEVMHAWLAQHGITHPDRRIVEGLCQVISYRWLRDQPDPLATAIREKIEQSQDPVYGNGFRMVRDSVKLHGMGKVLATLETSGRLL